MFFALHPTAYPTRSPTELPTPNPTHSPTLTLSPPAPTVSPTKSPTNNPTSSPRTHHTSSQNVSLIHAQEVKSFGTLFGTRKRLLWTQPSSIPKLKKQRPYEFDSWGFLSFDGDRAELNLSHCRKQMSKMFGAFLVQGDSLQTCVGFHSVWAPIILFLSRSSFNKGI